MPFKLNVIDLVLILTNQPNWIDHINQKICKAQQNLVYFKRNVFYKQLYQSKFIKKVLFYRSFLRLQTFGFPIGRTAGSWKSSETSFELGFKQGIAQ